MAAELVETKDKDKIFVTTKKMAVDIADATNINIDINIKVHIDIHINIDIHMAILISVLTS